MMMVHQSCRLQQISQVIETIGVHQQPRTGLLPEQVLVNQTNGMHPAQATPVFQLTGDLSLTKTDKIVVFLSITKPNSIQEQE
jgi:hypothetical protein